MKVLDNNAKVYFYHWLFSFFHDDFSLLVCCQTTKFVLLFVFLLLNILIFFVSFIFFYFLFFFLQGFFCQNHGIISLLIVVFVHFQFFNKYLHEMYVIFLLKSFYANSNWKGLFGDKTILIWRYCCEFIHFFFF